MGTPASLRPLDMPVKPTLRAISAIVPLLLAGCATAYHWGAKEDTEWSPRIGTATFTQVTQVLGQPVAQIQLPSGELKARWFGKPLVVNDVQGSMEDHSVEHSETRAYWRDMKFNKESVLISAWLSDQRELTSSEAP